MRFLAAPWAGLLADDVWIKNGQRANATAQKLAAGLGAELAFPCEASAVFLRLPEEKVARLHARGWHFYKFIEPDVYRLMCSWSVTDADIADFVADFRAV